MVSPTALLVGIIQGASVKILLLLLVSGSLLGCVSSTEDARIAREVSRHLDEAGVVPNDTREADRTHNGRMVYVGPGTNGNPHFTYYEVTSADDMALLEAAAQKALLHVPDANSVSLHFMEKQVFNRTPGGGGTRGHETQLREVVVRRVAH